MFLCKFQYSLIPRATVRCHHDCRRIISRSVSDVPPLNRETLTKSKSKSRPFVYAAFVFLASTMMVRQEDHHDHHHCKHHLYHKKRQGSLRIARNKSREDSSSVELMDQLWFSSWSGTFLKKAQRKKMVDVLNLMVNMHGLTEEQEELLFVHAVKQLEKALVKLLPGLMIRRMATKKGFDDFPRFMEDTIFKGLEKNVDLPYFSPDDRDQCIRCFTHFSLECMMEGENIDTILEDIGLLVAEIFLKGACVLLREEKRGELLEKVAEDIYIPVLPEPMKKALINRFLQMAADKVEHSFFEAFAQYQADHQKVDEEVSEEDLSRVHFKLSKLIHERMKEKLMEVFHMKYIKKEWYEDYLDHMIDKGLIENLLDREKMDTAGEAAVKMKEAAVTNKKGTKGSGMVINTY